ncbi:hypothetical protein FA10DRAFT_266688 [Acaromyces ingoldii]|uniref:RlpA-like protein double-psi beta-barrel domain-containing protein n=1 Tax=Acaromyces ingoldii TaxID=215250 RepID=A0A316YLR8_9BASI|nr:hypothetical protein FA10DRAFT_266688 [Acaromyces ingoldii]PWN90199.1 hypothetical protein FA10DRAFT_266688 [Acaromyces ingoldii]
MLASIFTSTLMVTLFALVQCNPSPVAGVDGWHSLGGVGHGGFERRQQTQKAAVTVPAVAPATIGTPPSTAPVAASAAASPAAASGRDTAFAACDNTTDYTQLTEWGSVRNWNTTDDKVFWAAPGQGACGFNYTLETNGICLHPGWVNSANTNGCNKWVQIFSIETGITAQARVVDSCGAGRYDAFGCNDALVTKQTFEILAGKGVKKALDDGHLPGSILFRFIEEPCWACNAGLPGMLPNGTKDDCTGEDYLGYPRCGRKSGNDRVLGPHAALVCNRNFTCPAI